MRLSFLITFLLLFLFSCAVSVSTSPITDLHKKPVRGTYYFPICYEQLNCQNKAALDKKENTWCSKHLFGLKEPILYNLDESIKVCRFTKIDSRDYPVSYRIEKKGGEYYIFKKQTDELGAYKVGSLKLRKKKTITHKDWEEIQNKLNTENFYELETNYTVNKTGSKWILESFNEKGYHFVIRTSPKKFGNDDFISLCNSFKEIYDRN